MIFYVHDLKSEFILFIIFLVFFLKQGHDHVVSLKLLDDFFLSVNGPASNLLPSFILINGLIVSFKGNEDSIVRCALYDFGLVLYQSPFLTHVLEPEEGIFS